MDRGDDDCVAPRQIDEKCASKNQNGYQMFFGCYCRNSHVFGLEKEEFFFLSLFRPFFASFKRSYFLCTHILEVLWRV